MDNGNNNNNNNNSNNTGISTSSSSSSTTPASAPNDTKRRVKLYVLNDARQWDDRGTGHVSWIVNPERQKDVTLQVKSEHDGSELLETKILPSIVYQKQQDTLIVWSDTDKRDLALSFQEKVGCDEIWEKICECLGKDPTLSVTSTRGMGMMGSDLDETDDDPIDGIVGSGGSSSSADNSSPSSDLPPCELNKLKEIRDFFVRELPHKTNTYKEKLTTILENESYIKKLIELFHISEDLDNIEGLNFLYEIFRSLFYLNKSSIFDILLSDEFIMEVIGCLEYDPLKAHAREPRNRHREFISSKSKFKQVIPFDNAELINKIHQTYRVQYIQDVILPAPSVFEENSLATLNSFIFLNKVEISNLIQEDDRFLSELFENLKSCATKAGPPSSISLNDEDIQTKRDMFLFLKEFISFSHGLQQTREPLYKSLYDYGILSVIEVALTINDDKINTIAIEIFSQFVEVAPTLVREFILNEMETRSSVSLTNMMSYKNKSKDEINSNKTLSCDSKGGFSFDIEFEPMLVNLVIKQMINDPDQELSGAMQIVNILKLLIDPENMLSAVNKSEKSEFLAYFYKKSMFVLLAPLMANTNEGYICRDDYRMAQLENLILDFLSFCVEHHTYHIKNYIIHKDLLKRILVLLKSKHQFLALSALRFLRKTISLKEETYNRYIIKANLFAPVIEALNSNGSRYNILNSAIIELFDFIRSDDIKSLISYIVENFYSNNLENISYVKTFRDLKQRYDKERLSLDQDRMSNRSSTSRLSSSTEGTPAFYRTRSSGDRFGIGGSGGRSTLSTLSNLERSNSLDLIDKEDAWLEEDDDDDIADNKTTSSQFSTAVTMSNENSNDHLSSQSPFIHFKKTNQNNFNDILGNEKSEDRLFPLAKTSAFGLAVSSKVISIKINKNSLNPSQSQISPPNNKNDENIPPTSSTSPSLSPASSPSSSSSSSPSTSPSSFQSSAAVKSKPTTLVDYEYDSDEEEDETTNAKSDNGTSIKEQLNTPTKDQSIEPTIAQKQQMEHDLNQNNSDITSQTETDTKQNNDNADNETATTGEQSIIGALIEPLNKRARLSNN